MDDVIKLPYNQRNSLRSKLIDALLEIRLSLSIKKIVSPTIAKSDFKKMLDGTKQKFGDVKDALVKVFEEYFPVEKKEESKKDLVEIYKKEEPAYEDGGSEKGAAMVKRNNNHFNSSREVPIEPTN